MPIKFDLKSLKEEHNCNKYFETGLYIPSAKSSVTKALQCGFDKCYSLEIRKDLVNRGLRYYSPSIKKDKLQLICDDSTNLKVNLDKINIANNDKFIFFLDAHVDNEKIKNYKRKCPLFEELEAIKTLNNNNHIILVDDVRILKWEHPWGETCHCSKNFFEEIKIKILEINPDYKFKFLDGHIENDVLAAYL
jgi:hypothetical protein